MKVSVIASTYQLERFPDLFEMLESLKAQSHENLDVFVVVDGAELYNRVKDRVQQVWTKDNIQVLLNENNYGLSYSRNVGVKQADGDIVAFIDDDAVADKDWVQNLVYTYEKFDAIGVGGKLLPQWVGSKPDYLPEELYWIVGSTHRGFADKNEIVETRNTFGANMSFKKEVFKRVGLFDESFGLNKKLQLQAEETEFSVRAAKRLGKNFFYNPTAIVYHKVLPGKTKLRYILRRAFWQGYSKHYLKSLYKSNTLSTESKYLQHLVFQFYFSSLEGLLHEPLRALKQMSVVSLVIAATGCGYIKSTITH